MTLYTTGACRPPHAGDAPAAEKPELRALIDTLASTHNLTDAGYLQLLAGLRSAMAPLEPSELVADAAAGKPPEDAAAYLFARARAAREAVYGKDVYLRGLIEFSSCCRNNCYYCGLRAGNPCAERYRLDTETILDCTDRGYELGFRTFVLQSGEDPWFTDERVTDLVSAIHQRHPDCAITLSIGEKSAESYQAWFDAGADRYLLRHETADPAHYRLLHPAELSLENRMRCLSDLKRIGYQVGCGMMIGAPWQTPENLLADIRYMQSLQPHMIGIGPFIPHKDTPFKDRPAGTLQDTVLLLAMLRLTFPQVLLPATTALGTIHPLGRELGLLAGANVIMPNLSPGDVRGKYLLYNGKISGGDEAAENCRSLKARIESVGYHAVTARGDYIGTAR